MRKREEKKGTRRRKKEEEKKNKIQVWNSCLELWYGIVWNSCWDYLYGTIINLFLSKLCTKNPIRNVVGWYEMSFMVYFEFWLSWFWSGRKFPVKRAKSGHFYILVDTPTARRRSARLGVKLCLGGGHYA